MFKYLQNCKQILPALKGAVQTTVTQVSKYSFAAGKPTVEGFNGCQAGAYIGYACSENAFIYPITPSTPMAELQDQFSAAGRLNAFGNVVQVDMMQSEAGAAGAVHGSLSVGSLCTTYTASQGLLLKIPNMYLIAGELTPSVFHIAARTLTRAGLSIHGDHSDVMAARNTGFAIMFCSNVQEIMDLGLACHISTVKSRVPFMCVQDGFRTSHEVEKCITIPFEDINKIFPHDLVQKNVRANASNPHVPTMKGMGFRPDVFFQNQMVTKQFQDQVPDYVDETLKEIAKLTNRHYKVMDYHGPQNPTGVIVIMGSGCDTVKEALDYLNEKRDYNCGVISVKLYRPWSVKHFLEVLPKSVQKITVLDRTFEDGAYGQPLFYDVLGTINHHFNPKAKVVGGVYGLSSKEFTPSMVKACVDNMNQSNPKHGFTIGITDDVTNTSLEVTEEINTTPAGTVECILWGLGSDGTIGAAQSVCVNIIKTTGQFGCFYPQFDAYKTDGTTCSHLRFGPKKFNSHYEVTHANFVSVHKSNYVNKYDLTKPLKQGGTLIFNSRWNTPEDMEANLPPKMLRDIAKKKIQLYNLDASQLAQDIGLGKRINSIMTTAFYKLSKVIPFEQADKMLRQDVIDSYGSKGQKIVDMNMKAIDGSLEKLVRINYPADKWIDTPDVEKPEVSNDEFYLKQQKPCLQWKGDEMPVSVFPVGGILRTMGTSRLEKRKICATAPTWIAEKCSQCNYCGIVCPHAVIRPFLLTNEELEKAPKGYKSVKAKGKELAGLNWGIQISSDDCTSCEVCVQACPDGCLVMKPYEQTLEQNAHFQYAFNLPAKKNPLDKFTVKGSQLEQPLLEFSGACAGCGETPYAKLMTQLFGRDMILANATGCSMIWAAMYPANPYSTLKDGRGPAFTHSLFEDNAEYGYGQVRALNNLLNIWAKQVGDKLIPSIKGKYGELPNLLTKWLSVRMNREECEEIFQKVKKIIPTIPEEDIQANQYLQDFVKNYNQITKRSFWQIGGDGWAYDIGYGGLDQVFNTKDDFNIVVVDTEMYSNTGGQSSKATCMGATVKFALGGKQSFKKDLGLLAMTYGNVYVAQVALDANYQQCVQAFKEAESYNGPSLLICFAPCIDWGFSSTRDMHKIHKLAVDSGYWPLYRYDPRKKQKFQLDTKKSKIDVLEFLKAQNRFKKMVGEESWIKALREHIKRKLTQYNDMAMTPEEKLDYLKEQLGEE